MNFSSSPTRARTASDEVRKPVSPLRVPGASAGNYLGRSLGQCLLRHLISSHCGLGLFARSLIGRIDSQWNLSEACSRSLPMPLPYPEVMQRSCGVPENDDSFDLARKKFCNCLVIVLNYLHLGRSVHWPVTCRLGAKLTQCQWKAVERFERFLDPWLKCDVVGPEEMGRTAQKVESIEEVLTRLEAASRELRPQEGRDAYFPKKKEKNSGACDPNTAGEVVSKMNVPAFSTFKPVEPDRLQFIGVPSFDPVPYLDPASAAIYERPLELSANPDEHRGPVPFVQVHCSPEEKMKLFDLLDSSRRLGLHRESEVRSKFCSGLFSVVKSLTKDRLILDSRPANLLERGEQRWIGSLAAAEQLCKIIIPSGHKLVCSGNDLRDFYYLFSVSEQRSRRNVLAGAVPTSKLRHLSCYRSDLETGEAVYGSLATLAMGDSQAVSLAQTCHVGMCLQSGLVRAEQLITLAGPLPREPERVGIIIDDFVSMSCVPEGSQGPSKSSKLSDDISDLYKKVGLIPHPDKAFRDEEAASFWGADVDGSAGTVRGSLKRAIPLAWLLVRVAKLGYSTVELLQTLSGSLVSLFLFRRRLLCLLDMFFLATRGREANDVVKLTGRLKSEMLICATLLPLAACNIRAEVDEVLVATDASDWGEAAVVAEIPSLLAQELYRHTLRKSVWTRLLAPAAAWLRSHELLSAEDELPDPEQCFSSNPLWSVLARCLAYKLLYKHHSKSRRHINVGELRGFLKAEKKLGLLRPSMRRLFALDSQVALGCIVKGRSASGALNREFCQSLGLLLFTDSYSDCFYYKSSENPADDPTRGAEVRKESLAVPEWLLAASCGDYSLMDSWLETQSIGDYQLTGLPPVTELIKDAGNVFPVSPQHDGIAEKSDLADPNVTPNYAVEQNVNVLQFKNETPTGKMTGKNDTLETECFEPLAPPLQEDSQPDASLQSCSEDSFAGASGNLEGSAASQIKQLLATFRREQVFLPAGLDWPPSEAGFLDLFSGERGAARELCACSNKWVISFDIIYDPSEDLHDPLVRQKIEQLLKSGAILGWGAAPVCASFSTAVTPAIRTLEEPYGKQDGVSATVKEKLKMGNDCATWLLSLMSLSLLLSIQFWIENPDLSWLFRLPCWKRFIAEHAEVLGVWRADYCRFGKKWRKRTRFLTTTCLKGHTTFCLGGHEHITLRGRSSFHRKSWTAVAQPYPSGVCKALGLGLSISCGLVDRERFDPASCARCSHARIGEAAQPGPRRANRDQLLESVPLVEARTAAMQSRFWNWFLQWLSSHLSQGAVDSLTKNPVMMCILLKEFGNHLFSTGKTLHVFRHLVVYIQKTFLETRPYMSLNWDMIARWEALEPPVHRTPIPSSIVRAMVSVAVLLGWLRCAGVLCIAFFGIMRPGEVLKAIRRDLVTPDDLLQPDDHVCYLRVGEPKPRRRGKGRTQHASVHDETVVAFLQAVFQSQNYDQLLYPVTPGSFRRRWDHLLKVLLVPRELNLTPGSLRGGGAVEAYRSGMDLTKLCWRMRLKNLATLESYIQEVAADSFLVQLTPESRERVQKFSSMFTSCLLGTTAPRAPL